MRLELNYGRNRRRFLFPEKSDILVLEPPGAPHRIEEPLPAESLRPVFPQKPGSLLTLAIPEAPVDGIFECLLRDLIEPALASGIRVTVLAGEREAIEAFQPAASAGCRLVFFDPSTDPSVFLGVAGDGVPVSISRDLAEADLKIAAGRFGPHRFAGFTGGAEDTLFRFCARDTASAFHRLMVDEKALSGVTAGNPLHEAFREAVALARIDFSMDAVLDPSGNRVGLVAGAPSQVLLDGKNRCASFFGVPDAGRFDIVIAAFGPEAADSGIEPCQQALFLAGQAVRPGGKILLLAAREEELGKDIRFDYVCQPAAPERMRRELRELVSEMEAEEAYRFGRIPSRRLGGGNRPGSGIIKMCQLRAADPEAVVREWVEALEGRARIAVFPRAEGTYFIPRPQDG